MKPCGCILNGVIIKPVESVVCPLPDSFNERKNLFIPAHLQSLTYQGCHRPKASDSKDKNQQRNRLNPIGFKGCCKIAKNSLKSDPNLGKYECDAAIN